MDRLPEPPSKSRQGDTQPLTRSELTARVRRGEMTEWPKVPDSKSGVGQPTVGSNPTLSARARASALAAHPTVAASSAAVAGGSTLVLNGHVTETAETTETVELDAADESPASSKAAASGRRARGLGYVRIRTGSDGRACFDEVSVAATPLAYAPPAPPFSLAEPLASRSFRFATFPPGYQSDWHPSPIRQFYFQLSGELEVVASTGETRRFYPGAVVLVEDCSGLGHKTRVVGNAPVHAAFVHLS